MIINYCFEINFLFFAIGVPVFFLKLIGIFPTAIRFKEFKNNKIHKHYVVFVTIDYYVIDTWNVIFCFNRTNCRFSLIILWYSKGIHENIVITDSVEVTIQFMGLLFCRNENQNVNSQFPFYKPLIHLNGTTHWTQLHAAIQ